MPTMLEPTAAIAGDRPVLVTGAAGFIGYHTARRLLEAGIAVHGVDDLNAYYDPQLKRDRLAALAGLPGFTFVGLDIADQPTFAEAFAAARPRLVVHLAAQAGVRHSLDVPHAYARANLLGFLNVLEACRHGEVAHLVYASSSSVYGAVGIEPSREHVPADHPLSLYGATKRANEVMAHSYSHLFALPTTGLRFFTVYGPWGRPDMAYYLFARSILAGTPIDVFGEGRMKRSFTYVDDVVEGLVRIAGTPPGGDPAWDPLDPDPATSAAPFRLYNIGNPDTVGLEEMIALLERALGREAIKIYRGMQPGDVRNTAADVTDLAAAVGYAPRTPLAEGLSRFADWFKTYHARAMANQSR